MTYFIMQVRIQRSRINVISTQAVRIRVTFFRAVLRQDIAWFDENSVGELTSRITDDINKIKNGIGAKIGNLIQVWLMSISSGDALSKQIR